MKFSFSTSSLVLDALCAACIAASVEPLPQAHSHNDYEHPRPLLDALDRGFCSVEADIWLVDGALLVAHDREKVDPARTLEKLYLDPLLTRVRHNNGRVYSNGPPFMLLIDFKSDAESTYSELRAMLTRYREMLTAFTTNETRLGAVTIVISGNRPTATVASEALRYVGIDGRLPDLESKLSRHLIPLISDNWTRHFQWRGEGDLPEPERTRLNSIVERAHSQGRKVRFWATPDRKEAWHELRRAGVDLINTDDLDGLKHFLGNAK